MRSSILDDGCKKIYVKYIFHVIKVLEHHNSKKGGLLLGEGFSAKYIVPLVWMYFNVFINFSIMVILFYLEYMVYAYETIICVVG